jgi:hypothetical protein
VEAAAEPTAAISSSVEAAATVAVINAAITSSNLYIFTQSGVSVIENVQMCVNLPILSRISMILLTISVVFSVF